MQALDSAAQEALPAAAPSNSSLHPHRPYISPTTLVLVARRHQLQREAAQHGNGPNAAPLSAALKALRRRIRHHTRRDAARHSHHTAQHINAMVRSGNLRGFWTALNLLGGPRAAALGPAASAAASRGSSSNQPSLATFTEHFETVHRCGQPVAQEVLDSAAAPQNHEPWQLPTTAVVLDAVGKLKSGRAADPAGVCAEALQAASTNHTVLLRLHAIILAALTSGIPAVAKESMLLPFHKKGDAADPNNYRGIQLISMLRKLLALILCMALAPYLEPRLLEYQSGFRHQRGCADQLFTLRQLAGMAVEWQQRLYVAFVDLRKAFDSINRQALMVILRARGVPEQLIGYVAELHEDTTCSVRVGGQRGNSFSMEFGVQQGCPLASILFNAFFDHVVREALEACPDAGITVKRRSCMEERLDQPAPARQSATARAESLENLYVPVLMLADDLAVLASSAEGLQRFITAFEAACQRWGLVISAPKTELMLIGGAAALACEAQQCTARGGRQAARGMLICDGCERGWHMGCLATPLDDTPEGTWHCPGCLATGGPRGDAWRPPVIAGGRPLAWVEKFKYLGSNFSSTGSLDTELARRFQLAGHAFRQLATPFFRQRCIPMKTRVSVYNSLVVAVLLYGSESWALTRAQLQRLEVFHRQRLRMILGVRFSDHVSNGDLYRRCAATPIATMLDRRQLRWLGHLGRMDADRVAKQALYCTMWQPGRSRRPGTQPPSLGSTYKGLVDRYLSAAELRRAGLGRRATWWSACQNRAMFRQFIP